MLRASLLPPILQLSHSSNTVPKIKSLRSINPYPQIQPFESCGRALKGLLAYVIPIFSLSSALRRPITLFTIRMAIISWQQSEPAGFSIRSSSYNTLHAHIYGCIYRNNTYTNPRNTDTYTLTLYTRPRSRVLLHWFRWCERGIGQTMNTKAHGLVYRDGGTKACSSRRGGPRNGRLLSSLVNNSFDIRGWKRTDDRTGWEGRERKLLKNWFLPFRIPFDQWAKHRCVASSLRVLAPNTCDWFKLKGRNPIEVVVEQTSEKKKRGKENRKKGE